MIRIDLHIHSALSPCADADMTPGNIVGMAKLKGLDVIAITDHQHLGNVTAAMALSQKLQGPLIVPGMEVTSAEEIHLLCLFATLEPARNLQEDVLNHLMRRPNRPDIFGEQILFDEQDQAVGHVPDLLLLPTQMSAQQIAARTLAAGGVCLPAHVDREANSMLATFGLIPSDFPTRYLEISRHVDPDCFWRTHSKLRNYPIIQNSDAHHLGDIAEPGFAWDLQIEDNRQAWAERLILGLRPDLYQ